MPSQELVRAFDRARAVHAQAVGELVPLFASLALESVRDVLPDVARLEVRGELNEDWLPILRIQRARGRDESLLFDAAEADASDTIESAIRLVNTAYLDPLFELTGDAFMGVHEIDAETVRALSPR